MKCPYCNGDTKVVDKRGVEELNRRRRECLDCSKRFTTYERLETEGILKIRKRDNRIVPFDQEKITNAIFSAAKAVGGKNKTIAKQLTVEVVKILNEKFKNEIPDVESIQDIVEKTLTENKHYKTAKAFMLYREKRTQIRREHSFMNKVNDIIDEYLDKTDWRVKENANEQFSFSGLLLHTSGKVIVNYALNKIYTPQIKEAFEKGYFHIHDLSHGFIGYCSGWSLKNLLLLGFGGVANKTDARPAKHLRTVVHHMVNYIGCLQMEFAGAQAFSSVDTLLAPFVRADNLTYKEVKQSMQELIYSLNIPSRWGCFAPNEYIFSSEGLIRIKDAKENQNIITKNGLHSIKKKMNNGKKKMFRLRTKMGYDVIATPNHRIRDKNLKFKELNDFKIGDKIPLSSNFNIFGNDKTIPNEEIAEIMGSIIADGCIFKWKSNDRKNKRRKLSIYYDLKDRDVAERHLNILKKYKLTSTIIKNRSSWMLTSVSNKAYDFFEKLGINEYKSYEKEIPETILKAPRNIQIAFLRGLFEADGSVFHRGQISYTTTSPTLAKQLKLMLLNLGIYSNTMLKKPRTTYIKGRKIVSKDVYEMRLAGNRAKQYKKEIGFISKRKKDILQLEVRDLENLSEKDYLLDEIQSIDSIGIFDSHDLTMNPNPEYIVNGFYVHNSQYPFSNMTFDWVVPEDMKTEKTVVGGKRQDFTYGDCQKESDMINKAFLEVMLEGDANQTLFSFPIPTYNLTKDFNWDSENAKLLFEMTAKYGTPYFQNYIGSDLDPKSIRAMCLYPNEEIIIKKNDKIQKTTIGNLVEKYNNDFDDEGWSENIHDIKALALNTDFKLSWTSVKRFLRLKGKILSKITTQDGKTIKVSSDHLIPVMTESGIKIKKSGELSKNDYLLTTRGALSALSKEYQKIDEYIFDEMFAKFIGLFISEGNYLYDSRKDVKDVNSLKGFQFTFNSKETDMIKELKNIIKEKFGYLVKQKKDKRYNTIMLYLYNTNLAKSLYRAGLRKYKKVIPHLFNSPKSVIEIFLDYFFKGDGYANGKEIHINDNSLSRDLTLLYTLIGKHVTYNERENSQVIRIQHNYGRGSKNKHTRDILYNRIPSFMVDFDSVHGMRRANFKQAETVDNQLLKIFGGHCDETLKILKNDVALVKVRGIEHEMLEKEQEFYDIELSENHLFVHSLGAITHNCCRLNMDLNQLINRPGHTFAAGDNTGSIGVMTININRVGYEAKTKEEYLDKLGYYMELAKESLEIKRKMLNKNLKNNLMPYTKRYLGTWKNHFSTIGLCGMNEACLNFLGKDISTNEGKEFTIETLKFMRDKLVEFQKETGNLYNLEATPAEGASYSLARKDKKYCKDIITAGKDEPYLTNSTHLPVGHTDDAISAIEHQNDIQHLYTGGTVFHTFLGEKMSTGESCKRLVKKIAYNTKLPYFTITPTFSVCKEHKYIPGEHFNCPYCGKSAEVYSRIVGYYRPVQNWHAGKQEEFKERQAYCEEKSLTHEFKTKIEKAIEVKA